LYVQSTEVFDWQLFEARQEDGGIGTSTVQLSGDLLGVVQRPVRDRPRRQRTAAQKNRSPEQISSCNIKTSTRLGIRRSGRRVMAST